MEAVVEESYKHSTLKGLQEFTGIVRQRIPRIMVGSAFFYFFFIFRDLVFICCDEFICFNVTIAEKENQLQMPF